MCWIPNLKYFWRNHWVYKYIRQIQGHKNLVQVISNSHNLWWAIIGNASKFWWHFISQLLKPTSLSNSSLTNTRQWHIRQGLFCWIFNLSVPLFWEPNGNWIIWCTRASLGYFESLLCRGVVAKSLRCGSGPSFHLSWCESGSVHDPHKSSCCPC